MRTTTPPVITQRATGTKTEQERFIAENIDGLAYFAYAHYRNEGRGLVGSFMKDNRLELGQVGKGNLYYLSARTLFPLMYRRGPQPANRGQFIQDLQNIIEFYDPRHSIIVGFLSRAPSNPGERMNIYLVDCVTPPPLAYAAYTN